MRFLSISSVHNQEDTVVHSRGMKDEIWFKNDTSIHKLCPQSGLKHSVVRFQGIEINFVFFQNIFLNEISIHKFCPQSGLRHSVVHAQGIGMKFKTFFFIFFGRNLVQK